MLSKTTKNWWLAQRWTSQQMYFDALQNYCRTMRVSWELATFRLSIAFSSLSKHWSKKESRTLRDVLKSNAPWRGRHVKDQRKWDVTHNEVYFGALHNDHRRTTASLELTASAYQLLVPSRHSTWARQNKQHCCWRDMHLRVMQFEVRCARKTSEGRMLRGPAEGIMWIKRWRTV
jgi:hypothetical protein